MKNHHFQYIASWCNWLARQILILEGPKGIGGSNPSEATIHFFLYFLYFFKYNRVFIDINNKTLKFDYTLWK